MTSACTFWVSVGLLRLNTLLQFHRGSSEFYELLCCLEGGKFPRVIIGTIGDDLSSSVFCCVVTAILCGILCGHWRDSSLVCFFFILWLVSISDCYQCGHTGAYLYFPAGLFLWGYLPFEQQPIYGYPCLRQQGYVWKCVLFAWDARRKLARNTANQRDVKWSPCGTLCPWISEVTVDGFTCWPTVHKMRWYWLSIFNSIST